MNNLNDERSIKLLDPSNMAGQIADFPAACALAWARSRGVSLPEEYRSVTSVVILGMGGSAISGDLVRTLDAQSSSLPIEVVRGYKVPGYVDRNTLVIAISFSGNTEETMAAFSNALERNATPIAIASGGRLSKLALGAGFPLYEIRARSQPRAALPHLYMPVIHALTSLDIILCPDSVVSEAIQFVAGHAPLFALDKPERNNPAKQIARALQDRIPSIYVSDFLGDVARRWKTQFNENSKQWAEFERLPEANHNTVVGYRMPAERSAALSVIQLQSSLYHERTRIRTRVTKELLDEAEIESQTVAVKGATRLAQQLYSIFLGDYVSYYLAILNGVDPTPVPPIDYLKSQLAAT